MNWEVEIDGTWGISPALDQKNLRLQYFNDRAPCLTNITCTYLWHGPSFLLQLTLIVNPEIQPHSFSFSIICSHHHILNFSSS